MIDGARRIGKSYIVEEFAQIEYKSYILVDFNNADSDLMEIFDDICIIVPIHPKGKRPF